MKAKILIFIAILTSCFSNVNNQKAFASHKTFKEDSIRIFSSPDLYDLTSNWAAEYCKTNKEVKIKIFRTNEKFFGINPKSSNDLYFVSNDYSSTIDQSVWKMIVGVDAFVPIINSNSPLVDEINMKGMSSDRMVQLFKGPSKRNWGTLLGNKLDYPVNFYTITSVTFKSGQANFLKIKPEMIIGINVENETEMISAIQKDPYSIGFCKLSSILDDNGKTIIQGLKLLPIDKNGNGKIDFNEKIYDDLSTFLRGVWIGKYPQELCKNIYSISNAKPTNDRAVAFLAWVITDGQQYLNTNGFGDIAFFQRQANISNLLDKEVAVKTTSSYSILPIAIILLLVLIVLFFTVDFIVQRYRFNKTVVVDATIETTSFIDEKSISILDGLYFDKSHTWAFLEKNGAVSIGIDDFLQHVTGPITRIKMKNIGEEIKKGEPFLTIIQEGKQLTIKAPISGKIKDHNNKLLIDSSLLNASPYSEGWIYMIEPTNWLRDTQFLIIAQGYREWIKMELLHLKDFLAIALRANYPEAQIVLQDGGEIKEGILKDLKPEVWEDFQTHFLDCSK
jgi:glycine cleavage system H lipoate-binding protein/ABC-type phosphate transport system substrate-binding protein